jgi:gas vesicle protein
MTDQQNTFPERRREDYLNKALREDVQEIKSTLKELTNSMIRLAIVEEKHSNTASGLERAFGAIKEVMDRVAELEQDKGTNRATTRWVEFTIGGVIAAVGTYIATHMGLK